MSGAIFALATAPGRSALAVIRVSGPGTGAAVSALAGRLPRPRRASLRTLRDAAGQPIDEALVLWFPAPRSYTGDDVAELHLHGGPAVVDAVSERLAELGLTPAEPGAFTRRAFENGRLSLDRAEAVADLIDAETAAQARQAIAQLEGALGRRHRAWRETLIAALAALEAEVDFPDEEDPAGAASGAARAIAVAADEIGRGLAEEDRGRRVREGYRVAIIGAPNAGKSSILNALLDREAAITADTPGTTRDVIEAPLDISGYRLLLADTAGLRDSVDPIEQEGGRRARAWAESADLRLWVVDGAAAEGAWRLARSLLTAGDIAVINKTDLPAGRDGAEAREAAAAAGAEVVAISARAAEDRRTLNDILARRAMRDLSGGEFPAATRQRHAERLREAQACLHRAAGRLQDAELAAEDVRLALRALERITGKVGAEDVLDRIFAQFCIGK